MLLNGYNTKMDANLTIRINIEDFLEEDMSVFISQGFCDYKSRLVKTVELFNKDYKLWQNPSLLDTFLGKVKKMSSDNYNFKMSIKRRSYNANFSQIYYDVNQNKPVEDSLERKYLKYVIQKQFELFESLARDPKVREKYIPKI